jgi:hypothetical protein
VDKDWAWYVFWGTRWVWCSAGDREEVKNGVVGSALILEWGDPMEGLLVCVESEGVCVSEAFLCFSPGDGAPKVVNGGFFGEVVSGRREVGVGVCAD